MKRTKRLVATLCSALVLTATVSMPAFAHNASSTAPTTTAPWKGTVTTSSGSLNVRSDAKDNATIKGSLGKGSYAHLIGKSGNWFKVYYNMSGSTGFASGSYLSYSRTYAKTKGTDVRIRAGMSTTSGINATVSKSGTGLPYITYGNSGGYRWNRVVYRTTTGYVRGDVSTY